MNPRIRSVDHPDVRLEDVLAFARDARERAERLRADAERGLRADATGEAAILLGALARVAARVEERLQDVLGGEVTQAEPRPAPSTPALQPEPERKPLQEMSAPAMVALDMIARGASREEAEAYLRTHLSAEEAHRVLDELFLDAA